ncbi:MAG: hypothetical protein RIC95_02260 [Vicingaceae bacterium]
MKQKLLIFIFSLFFLACEKDKDEVPPQVFFESPTSQRSYDVLDLINVKIQASDNEKIERLSLSLTSASGRQTVLPAKTVEVGQASFSWETTYFLSDSLLAEGKYNLKVEAFDGENEFAAFREITIKALARRRLGLLAVCNQSDQAQLYQYSNDQASLLYTKSSRVKKMVCNSFDQALWFLPQSGNEIEAYRLKQDQLGYQASVVSPFSNPAEDLVLDERQLFYSHSGGEVKGVNPNFGDNFLYQANSGNVCEKLAVNEEYVLVEESNPNGANRRLNILFRGSGATYNTLFLQKPIVDMALIDEEFGICLQHENGNLEIVEISLSGPGRRVVRTLSGVSAKQLVQENNRIFYILTDQSVIRYDYQTNNYFTLVSNVSATEMRYDFLNQAILLAEGQTIKEYDDVNGNLIETTNFPSPVSSFSIRYNR